MDPAGSEDRKWEASYQAGETPWDKGRAHPALLDWLSRNQLAGLILVPGSGAGHDVRALAANAMANVVGLDLAPSAKVVAESFPKAGSETYLTGDFLSGFPLAPNSNGANLSRFGDVGQPSRLPACRENSRRDACSTPLKLAPFASGSFDAVFEHTCFCAIPPDRRMDYVRAVSKSLKPGGLFLAIFYRNPSARAEPGPPFGCPMDEVDALFGNEFLLLEERTNLPTFEGRENREVLRLMKRR